jgi:hypothetical protein
VDYLGLPGVLPSRAPRDGWEKLSFLIPTPTPEPSLVPASKKFNSRDFTDGSWKKAASGNLLCLRETRAAWVESRCMQ